MVVLDMEICPCRKNEVIYRTVKPDLIILNLDNGFYYSTNEVGAMVWELCDGSMTVKEIIESLSEAYDADIQVIEKDAVQFIRDTAMEGLLLLEKK